MTVVVDRVGASYGMKEVLRDVSFNLKPGEITGLVGPNGHGKTTLMKRMLDLVPGTGVTTFNGKTYSTTRRPQLIVGSLISAASFHPRRSAINHLRMVGATTGMSKYCAQSALVKVGLGEYGSKSPASYSMGMKQRLALAAALMLDPQVLILDEPINGLDVDGVNWFRNTIRGLANEGRTILLSTHILGELEKFADRILVLQAGKLRADCSMAELGTTVCTPMVKVVVDRPDEFAARLRTETGLSAVQNGEALAVEGATAREVGSMARSFGFTVFELSTVLPTLEDAYSILVDSEASESHQGTTQGNS